MILEKLTLSNFRQFKGTQQIEFAKEPGGTNATVVFGENGRGKTTIYRALIFCLFGDRRLSQDDDTPQQELQLVNTTVLREAAANTPVSAYVEAEFSANGERHVLRRELRGMLTKEGVLEELGPIRLQITLRSGNTKIIEDPAEVDAIVQKILDRRMKDYFLFDGERIERLTRASGQQRQEIAKGIRCLLNVDALEKAIKVAKRVSDGFEDQVGDQIDVERARLANQLREVDNKITGVKAGLNELADEVEKGIDEKRRLDQLLSEYAEIRHLVEQRQGAEAELASIEQDMQSFLEEMRSHTAKTATLLVMPTVSAVFAGIDQRKKRGEIPPEIRRELIEKILEDHKCICGHEVREGSEAWQHIIAWHEKVGDPAIHDAALDLWRYLSDVMSKRDDICDKAHMLLFQYGNATNKAESVGQKIERLDERIGSSNRQDAKELEEQRTLVELRIRGKEAHRVKLGEELNDLSSTRDRVAIQLEEKDEELRRSNVLVARARLARRIHDVLSSVHTEFTSEIRNLIGQYASEHLRQFIDELGRHSIERVVVDEGYALQVYGPSGDPFLANISSGQRQITSIAFITALARCACGTDSPVLQMPLFMDAPFGRLSSEHRQNLISALPEVCSQWILLATDTEFRRTEARWLRDGGHWGRFVHLRSTMDGSTVVEETSVSDAFAVLSREDEV